MSPSVNAFFQNPIPVVLVIVHPDIRHLKKLEKKNSRRQYIEGSGWEMARLAGVSTT